MLNDFMKWIMVAILVVDIVLILFFIFFRTKNYRGRSYASYFDFDQYKERELLRRGVIDRAKW